MKLFKLFLACSVIMLIYSCSDDDLSKADSDNQSIDNAHICGYDYYTQTEQSEGIQTRQEEFADIAIGDPCDVATLTLSIDNCLNAFPQYITAVNQAVAMYNNIPNCEINITIVADNADFNIACMNEGCVDGGITGGTAAQLYDDNFLSNSILVNTNIAGMNTCCGFAFGQCDFTGLVVHEIGHVIGLAHTGSGNGVQIAGTPINDPNSILNGGSLCAGVCAFSANDILALQTMYPPIDQLPCECPISPSIQASNTSCVGEVRTFCINGLEAGWTSTLTTAGNSVNMGTAECLDVTYTEEGLFEVSVEICPNGFPDCCVTTSIDIRVFPAESRCYCVCELWDPADGTFGADIKFGKDGEIIKNDKSGNDDKFVNEIKVGKDGKIVKGKGPYWEQIVEVDCCDERDCSEIVAGWWDEYLVDRRDCYKEEIPCTPPQVSIQAPNEICIGETAVICVSGFSGPTSWTVSGSSLNSSTNCIEYTPTSLGSFTVSTVICEDDCCVSLSKSVSVSDCIDECYCRCWVQEQSGDDTPYQEDIEVDCDDEGDCEDIIPGWWDEYLTSPVDCTKVYY